MPIFTICRSRGGVLIQLKDYRECLVYFSITYRLALYVPKCSLNHLMSNNDGGYQAVEYNYSVPTSEHPVFHAVRLRRKRSFAITKLLMLVYDTLRIYLSISIRCHLFTNTYLHSQNNRMVVNGVNVLTHDTQMDTRMLYYLAHDLYIYCFKSRY